MVGKGLAAILIMTEFSLLREAPALKPPKATAKPYTRHILGIDSGLQSHPKATLKPPQSHTKATPKPTTQAISKAGGRGNRLFSQDLGHNENCWGLKDPSHGLAPFSALTKRESCHRSGINYRTQLRPRCGATARASHPSRSRPGAGGCSSAWSARNDSKAGPSGQTAGRGAGSGHAAT